MEKMENRFGVSMWVHVGVCQTLLKGEVLARFKILRNLSN